MKLAWINKMPLKERSILKQDLGEDFLITGWKCILNKAQARDLSDTRVK